MWLVICLILVIVFIIVATSVLKLHPFLSLLAAAFGFGLLTGMPLDTIIDAVNTGFGGTIGYIGIVILAGTIIGKFLEQSGGALRLAEGALRLTGRKNVPAAMGLTGYVVSMPVFCDSGFVILSPLNKALAHRARITLASGAIALSLGLYATHTMVPPTPGPIAAAGIVGADLGLVILWGMVVAIVALVAGWLFAVTYAARFDIPPYKPGEAPEAERLAGADAPSTFKSMMPLLLPIVLIVLRSIAELPARPLGEGVAVDVIGFIGQPVVALLIGVVLAFTLPKRLERAMLSTTGWVGQAVIAAALIIIITGSGGAFGRVLRESGIADVIGGTLADADLGVWLPFLIAAGIKTAQGSSTVAIVTTAGIVAPLLEPIGLDSETGRALSVVAIGAGSMCVSHANDSYFWVVTQFSNMDVQTGYKLQTLGTLIQGLVAAVTVWLLSMMVL